MGLLKVHNWDKWQSFRKDRGAPPWIKVHRSILMHPDFIDLSDAERWHLIGIWLLASERNGYIPDDPGKIRKLLRCDEPINLEKFLDLQVLEKTSKRRQPGGNQVVTRRLPNDRLETETEKIPPIVPPEGDDFSEFWQAYPRREGKGAAEKAWRKLKAADRQAALDALPNHRERWNGTERKFLPHPSTWLNQRRWEDEIDAPASPWAGAL